MLTDTAITAAIRKAAKEGRGRTLSDGSGRGQGRLVLMIRPGLKPEWYAQQWAAGKKRLLKIGTFPELPLVDAREAFRGTYAPAIRDGASIRIAATREVGTVSELFTEYVEHLKANGKRSWRDCEKNLPRIAKLLGETRPANRVATPEIVEAIRPHYARGKKSMADHLRSYVRSAYSWAIKAQNDYRSTGRTRNYALKTNPAEWIPTEPKVIGSRWLTPAELLAFWKWLEGGGAPVPGKAATLTSNLVAIQFMIASGQRVEEVCRIRGEWVDLRQGLIEWPTTKNGRHHALPITQTMRELLDRIEPNEHGLLFPSYKHSDRPVHNQTIMRIFMRYLEQSGADPFCPRDLRRTWKTLAGEAGVSKTDRDLVQNHARQDVASKHYDRYDYFKEKRAAVDMWDAWFRREVLDQ